MKIRRLPLSSRIIEIFLFGREKGGTWLYPVHFVICVEKEVDSWSEHLALYTTKRVKKMYKLLNKRLCFIIRTIILNHGSECNCRSNNRIFF